MARHASIDGLKVIDSHGIIIGRVARTVPNDAGEIRSLIVVVDKEPLRTSLGNRGMPEAVEVDHEKVAAIGDVVILSDVFSSAFVISTNDLSHSVHSTGTPQLKDKWCSGCSAVISSDDIFCINCGRRLKF